MGKQWKKEENGVTTVTTCAWSPPGCHPVGCGLKLTVKDNKLIKVEGDPEHPITQGRLCPRCLALKEYVHHPDRIIYPMKRTGKRGENNWERITWDEAYDTIVAKVAEMKQKYGPESIIVFGGTGRESTQYYPLLATLSLGTPNACYPQSGQSCYFPRALATGFLLGPVYPEIDYASRFWDRYDHPGWELPKYILLWGKEPLKSNGDGLFGHAIIDMMKRGTKIIMVDPRMNWLATRAEHVLRVRPGTDAALALGMLNVIINEELYDKEFVDKWTYGFDKLRERVQEYPPEKVEEITWVPKEQIIEVARILATEKPNSIGWGLAVDQNPNGVQVGQAIMALMAITGSLDVPGGITLGAAKKDYVGGDVQRMAKEWAFSTGTLSEESYEKRIGSQEYPALCAGMVVCHPDSVLDTLESGQPYELKMGFFTSTNVISPTNSACPDRWYEGLKKMEFNVVTDLFMTPTAMALADIFLPLATFAEHDGIVESHYGLNSSFKGAINKALTVGECKSDAEIVLDLGKRINPQAFPFENVIEFIDFFYKGLTFSDLREQGLILTEEVYKKYEKGLQRNDGQPGFETPSGRLELYSHVYEMFGDDPLPYYVEPIYSPVNTPELAKEYPLILTTGARTYVSFHSEHRQIPSLREIVPDPEMEIHPDTAKKLGIQEGNWVIIENQFGKARMKAHVTPIIDPRVVHAQHGWWFPEKKAEAPSLFGVWESNINTLMPHKHIGKLGLGDTFKSILCKVYKAD